ncbi:MAG: phosphoribosyltransferase family protein [Thermoanaerobaculia bacterium]
MKKAFSAKDIARRVNELGEELRKDAGDSEIFLLGVLRGTTCFVADLLRSTPGSVSYGFINVVRDIADTEIATAMEIDFLNWIDISGKHVYLLKDVVSTGIIETYLLTQLRQKSPAALKLIALLDRPAMRTVDLITDYHAFKVDDGAFVGYGLELDGSHANLPYIARL